MAGQREGWAAVQSRHRTESLALPFVLSVHLQSSIITNIFEAYPLICLLSHIERFKKIWHWGFV